MKTVFLAAALMGSQGWVSTAHGDAQTLGLVFPEAEKHGERVAVSFALDGDVLVARFEVNTSVTSPEKKAEAELYNGNVVELFICTTTEAGKTPRPYYEFEVSPYDQELQVLIDEKGHGNEKWKTPQFKHSAIIRPNRPGWDAEMRIPLKDIKWDGDMAKLSGNAFAILGSGKAKRYYSLNLPKQTKPSFHKPEFFKPFQIK